MAVRPAFVRRGGRHRPRLPGERLGLPAQGTNSVAGFGRRFAATTIDWILASLMVSAFVSRPSQVEQLFLPPAAFALLNIALVTTIGAGIGGRVLGMRVARLDGSNPPLVSVLLRTFLMSFAVPAPHLGPRRPRDCTTGWRAASS